MRFLADHFQYVLPQLNSALVIDIVYSQNGDTATIYAKLIHFVGDHIEVTVEQFEEFCELTGFESMIGFDLEWKIHRVVDKIKKAIEEQYESGKEPVRKHKRKPSFIDQVKTKISNAVSNFIS